MKIGIAQIHTTPGDLAGTCERIVTCSRIAAERGAELVFFPLTCFSGPHMLPYFAQRTFERECEAALRSVVGKLACDCAIPVLFDDGDLPEVEILYAHEGTVRGLRGYERQLRRMALSKSDRLPEVVPLQVLLGELKVRFAFDYDDLDLLGEPDDPGGYELVVYVGGHSFMADVPSSAMGASLMDNRYCLDAQAAHAWLVGVASVGGYGGQVFSGSSFVISPEGLIAACAPAFEEDVVVADVGPEVRMAQSDVLRFELYDASYHCWQALSCGLHDFVCATGSDGVAFVYDATLGARSLAALACDALGPTKVHPMLPVGATQEAANEAKEFMKPLRIVVDELDDAWSEAARALAENAGLLTTARLQSVAATTNSLVLSTGDKTGFAFGEQRAWDVCASLAPFGDSYRSDVLAMLRLRGAIAPLGAAIDLGTQDVALLDGLGARGNNPELTLGELDELLRGHMEGDQSFAQLVATADDEQRGFLGRVAECFAANESSPGQRLSCLIASSCTLGEARFPLGFAWHEAWNKAVEVDSEDGSQHSRKGGGSKPVMPPKQQGPTSAAAETALREALDLLRDISVGSGTDWRNPFSEN